MSNLFLAQTTDWPTYSGFRIVLSSTDSTDPKIEIYNSENNE